MPDTQRILVVRTTAGQDELLRVSDGLGRDPVALVAPTVEAKLVVQALAAQPQVELLLAPARFPAADRGHQLDSLVRRHALADRFRDVVVVTDPATSTLLLRVLAPDQLSERGAVTVVGLPRPPRRLSLHRAAASGVVLGVVATVAETVTPIVTLPAVVAVLGLLLLLVPALRHVGRELLLTAAAGFGVVVLLVSSSQRFPG